MNARERIEWAKAIVDEFEGLPDLAAMIAQALGEAENDALERAAKTADGLMEAAKDPRSYATASCISQRIRSLKEPTP